MEFMYHEVIRMPVFFFVFFFGGGGGLCVCVFAVVFLLFFVCLFVCLFLTSIACKPCYFAFVK